MTNRARLGKVVVATVAVQAIIVMASLTVPVLASLIAPAAGAPAYLVGYYAALIYGCAAATSLLTPTLMQRCGGLRLHQGMLVMTAAAMALLVAARPAALVLSAIVLGAAYGPMNPASTVMLSRDTPARWRARVFSLKQTAVPAGGALAGFAVPLAAAAFGWRGAVLLLAALCVALAALIQPWRREIDRDDGRQARGAGGELSLPVRIMVATAGLRTVAISAFGFGAVQFSFAAVFPTVLVTSGWSLRGAGAMLSFALVIGVLFRVVWGGIADRIGPRPVLGVMGGMMCLAEFTAALLGPGWPPAPVFTLAAAFGLSAYCWAGIGIAEAVRQAPPAMVPAASAGMIGMTFLGALAGPALFSTATAVTGSFRPAFLLLGAVSAIPVLLLRGSGARQLPLR